MNARDHRKRTPLHLAAEEGEEELITFLLDNKADSSVTDLEGNTPLDLAAKEMHADTVNLIVMHSQLSKKDDVVKKSIEMAMDSDRVKDDVVKRNIEEMSPFGYCLAYVCRSISPSNGPLAPYASLPSSCAASSVCSSHRNLVACTSSSSSLPQTQSSR